jgi:3',5'-cyclic AMP phosphodiesterase CpdA
MRKLIHLSDLHFGRIDKRRVQPLLDAIKNIKPDLVVISGDLTQRATKEEFMEAKKFIEDIKFPTFIVPGNHDISLYNIFTRMFAPFRNYKKYISNDLDPLYVDKEIALIGINSVNRFNLTSGRISKKQIKEIGAHIKGLNPALIKIAVCHHPFDIPPVTKEHPHIHKVVARSKMAIKNLAQHKVDIFLSGHLHVHYITDTTIRYKIKGYKGLLIQAGTAISNRERGEPVSFNVLNIDGNNLTIDHYAGNFTDSYFTNMQSEKFLHTGEGWVKQQK